MLLKPEQENSETHKDCYLDQVRNVCINDKKEDARNNTHTHTQHGATVADF